MRFNIALFIALASGNILIATFLNAQKICVPGSTDRFSVAFYAGMQWKFNTTDALIVTEHLIDPTFLSDSIRIYPNLSYHGGTILKWQFINSFSRMISFENIFSTILKSRYQYHFKKKELVPV